ncbi:MAG: hypothetical protein J7518_17740 [Nocardioidaceae bacterium]|nr:hypothetical protein [Nocardioidaceae bacterium]
MNEQESWSAGYQAGWDARDQAGPPAWRGRGWHGGWHRGWFPVPFLPLVIFLGVLAAVTHTWWVLLGIPVLWLLTAPLRRRRWASRGYC